MEEPKDEKGDAIRRIIAMPEWKYIEEEIQSAVESLIYLTSIDDVKSAEDIAVDVRGRKYAIQFVDRLLNAIGVYEGMKTKKTFKRSFR